MDGINGWSSFYHSDHSLFSVYFIDQNTGWIACDEGFVLTSNDGGESWNEISTGITQTLRSIFFINSSIFSLSKPAKIFNLVLINSSSYPFCLNNSTYAL